LSRRRGADHWTRKAKARAYPARSVFKLEEIDARLGLLGRGDRVLDLGCAPGSWLLYASRKVGPGGRVVGVDLASLDIAVPSNVQLLTVDVLTLDPGDLPEKDDGFDAVLSDMAPSTSGAALVDQERSWELFERAVTIAVETLRPGGGFVGKLFSSPRHEEALSLLRERFSRVRTLRPRATRSASREVFVTGLGFGKRR